MSSPIHRPSAGLLEDTRGLATIEYVVILALIAVAGVSAWQGFGATVTNRIGLSAEAIAGINPPGTPTGGGASMDGVAASALPPGVGGEGADITPAGDTNVWDDGGVLGAGNSTGVVAASRALVDIGAKAATEVNEAGWWVWDRVTSPLETSAAISAAVAHAVMNPRETGRAALNTAAKIGDGINKAVADGVRACVGQKAYSCTRALGTLFVEIIPGKGLTTGAKGLTSIGNTRADRLRLLAARSEFADPSVSGAYGNATRGQGPASAWTKRTERIDENHELLGPRSMVPGHAVNLSTDARSVAAVTGDAYEVAGHASAGGRTLNGYSTAAVARGMVETGGYRGGDVVLRACHSACSPIPQNIRRELDSELARQGHPGRVGTIVAPTSTVDGLGTVKNGGHWHVFDEDNPMGYDPPGT